jgi:hypothetical protein
VEVGCEGGVRMGGGVRMLGRRLGLGDGELGVLVGWEGERRYD